MNKNSIFLFLVLSVFITKNAHGQTAKEVFQRSSNILWIGLDFTKATFVGDRAGFRNVDNCRQLIIEWNSLIISEPGAFNFFETFHEKNNFKSKISITVKHNESIDLEDCILDLPSETGGFTKNTVSEIVSTYDFEGNTGIGLMFIVESFNKTINTGTLWVTFVDMGNNKVLFTEKVVGKPGGFGMRNYWAGAIKDILKYIRKQLYYDWQRKYQ